MPEIPKGSYIKKNGKWVRRITLAQVQIEFQKKPFQKTPKDIETIKKILIEYAKMNLPPNERHKMIACVKNVKTQKDLEEAIELAEKYAEQQYKLTSGKKKQNKKTTPPEPRSKKEIEEQISGIMKHPALKLFADDKKFKEICVGDIERPTEFDEFIVQESDNAEIVVKSQIARLAKESDYITMQLERWKNEKIKDGDVIAEWYKRAERPFTCRLLKAIHTSCEHIEPILAMRREMSHLRKDFETGYERLVAVAGKCDIERAKWFGGLPVKPINDFRSAAEEFQRIVLMIYSEAKIELDRLTKPAKIKQETSGNAEDTKLAPAEEKAYQGYEYAIKKWPDLAGKTDEKVHVQLSEDGIADYDPPSFDTWTRQLRTARKHYGTNKNTPRAGRESNAPKANNDPDLIKQISNQYTKPG